MELLETEVKEINTNQETLKRNLLDLIELKHILIKTQTFFEQVIIGRVITLHMPSILKMLIVLDLMFKMYTLLTRLCSKVLYCGRLK